MLVLIVRHAPAGGAKAKARYRGRDAERPLTAEGKDKMRAAARGLERIAPKMQAIATSPYRRARQTADILARRIKAVVLETPVLEPDAVPSATERWLRGRKEGALVLVGHEPHLGRLVGWLCTGRAEPFTELKKGHACLLELPGGARAKLLWSLAPRQLRRL